jgi:hypothetical protein
MHMAREWVQISCERERIAGALPPWTDCLALARQAFLYSTPKSLVETYVAAGMGVVATIVLSVALWLLVGVRRRLKVGLGSMAADRPGSSTSTNAVTGQTDRPCPAAC